LNNKKSIAILIPCYNKEKTIKKVVEDWKKELPEAIVYVYDNNSTDNTIEEALSAGAIIKREYQQGKGNVIRRMFMEIDADCYLMVDGDDTYSASKAKVSKLNTYSDGFKVLKTICRLFKNYKPFCFFGIISFILLISAIGLFIPVLIEFFNTGLVPKFPTLIVSGFIAISAIISFFSGLILETVQEQHKREFEFKLSNNIRGEK
jgi:glycosyltransferase involved in cell wall biosynthesis